MLVSSSETALYAQYIISTSSGLHQNKTKYLHSIAGCLEEQVGYRARLSGGINTRSHICSDPDGSRLKIIDLSSLLLINLTAEAIHGGDLQLQRVSVLTDDWSLSGNVHHLMNVALQRGEGTKK